LLAVGYTEKVVVAGAGISGLACAFRLKQLGVAPLVLEADERAGGVIATIQRNGFLFELGPQCPRFPAPVWQLVRDLRLQNEFVAGDAKAKRYIVRQGKLHRAPFSPTGVITTRLLGLRSKSRLLTEAFRSSHPPSQEESLAEFVQRKFGEEVLDNLVDPFISTIFFGDAQKMGMQSAFPALVEWERNHGSLVRGALRTQKRKQKRMGSVTGAKPGANGNALVVTDALPALGSFPSGMARLPGRLAEELRQQIRYKSEIVSVAALQNEGGRSHCGWLIGLSTGENIAAEHLVLAVPAYTAGQLLRDAAPPVAGLLKGIAYAPIRVVASGYDRSKVANTMDGFGFMVPRREGLRTICTFWNSSLFPQRAPAGSVLLTSFAAEGRPENDGTLSDDDLLDTVEKENAKILGIQGSAEERIVWKNSRALPQYNVGHAQRITEIEEMLSSFPSLHLAGNFLKGRSIGDCVELGFRIAEDVHSQMPMNHI
jgi:protoporphyrinogen/coproporphyrinogen III oxidase